MPEQLPDCPVCHLTMFPNIEGKAKNPAAPDFKCSDPACKFQWDKATKTYIPSQYRTSKWADKIASPYPNAPRTQNIAPPTPNTPPTQAQGLTDLSEVVSLLKEIRDLLKDNGVPEPLKGVVYPEEDLSEFGA